MFRFLFGYALFLLLQRTDAGLGLSNQEMWCYNPLNLHSNGVGIAFSVYNHFNWLQTIFYNVFCLCCLAVISVRLTAATPTQPVHFQLLLFEVQKKKQSEGHGNPTANKCFGGIIARPNRHKYKSSQWHRPHNTGFAWILLRVIKQPLLTLFSLYMLYLVQIIHTNPWVKIKSLPDWVWHQLSHCEWH